MLGPLLLFTCALLWGTAFVAQKEVVGRLGPFAIIFSRSILAAAFLFVWTRLAKGGGFTRKAAFGGALSGIALFFAILAQQLGIEKTTPGIAAFLTTNYLLIVPVLGVFLGRKTHRSVWFAVALALVGTYFICMPPGEDFRMGSGEALELLCALLFALQILVVDRFARDLDVVAFSCVQMLVCGLLAIPFFALGSETAHFNLPDITSAALPVLYLGLISSGVAYTFQNLGQVRTSPALAAVLMSLESVFGALSGYLYYGDVITVMQFTGCALVFGSAVFVSVTPYLKKR